MGCQENFPERDGWKPRPGPFGSASEGTPAGSVPWADRPVKPESHERGRRAESAIGSKEELEAARHAATAGGTLLEGRPACESPAAGSQARAGLRAA